ncbi:hypothetical protein [Acinetobacter variabilis]|uniref:hypothetical protein n=1 Tax=Acinetobacter variabilis TaxID=70346 RepID=UPI00376FF664
MQDITMLKILLNFSAFTENSATKQLTSTDFCHGESTGLKQIDRAICNAHYSKINQN